MKELTVKSARKHVDIAFKKTLVSIQMEHVSMAVIRDT